MAELSLDRGLEVLGRRAKLVNVALVGFAILSVLSVIASAGETTGLVDLDAMGADALSTAAGLVYVLYLISYLACAILVGMWIYRAHANLHAAGLEDPYSPGWAVGWFFVPIANLVKPYDAMRELCNASLIHSGGAGGGHVGGWWAAWLVGGVLTNVGSRLELSSNAGLVQPGLIMDAIGTIAFIIAAWLLAEIVRAVTAGQDSVMTVAEVFS